MANKKGKDTRPSRQQQKARSTANKRRKLEKHLKNYPKDENAQAALDHVTKTGNSRGRPGINASIEVQRLQNLKNKR